MIIVAVDVEMKVTKFVLLFLLVLSLVKRFQNENVDVVLQKSYFCCRYIVKYAKYAEKGWNGSGLSGDIEVNPGPWGSRYLKDRGSK